ncbi:phospho-N-acetylmuramoyl-pentapeptide-transferase [Scardovia inopinata]|uniref:Phospho-N-acetylmuramoyl-pentapeptide-transferase n=1 Tax=Scardovia inopinata F0304 TaxID=641146 RepID=W5IK82_SCAIO|nr:phospho-N-acetylmuramoyl-pentapeptide-transferase [Scardovia inopinata]EFG27331.1 phospho-N-acetylmuramoyl-pentapeptide-transferase [Scardovia inopinata F0304]BAR06944.1 phospho-N-acetylmuramoyl-pentapeptide-transferase [Scardovia inopinata JCM 12537]SUV51009.1 phospho-N-acetylmuramoyl-pentapeptide-transferase [Scardovia inopinata]
MIALIIGLIVSLIVIFTGTPIMMRIVERLHYGQYIRQDGPQSHLVKRGTPTMGGVVINLAILLGWFSSALYRFLAFGTSFSIPALLVLFAMLSMGALGFIDDFAKVSKKQNEGLSVRAKFIGQFIFATIYAVLSLMTTSPGTGPAAHPGISFSENLIIDFQSLGKIAATILFVIWVNLLMTAWTNAFNLTDGLDGLCAGSSMVAFLGYGLIAFWQSYHRAGFHLAGIGRLAFHQGGMAYTVADPQDLAIIAVCAVAACFGFLWYNTNPAQIFMGDTGSLALGGLFAALSIATHTEVLAIIIGGLFVVETLSDVIQVGCFKATHKRVFKMAPIHHHFELLGWPENKVVVRFWMVEMIFVILGVIIFYGDWVFASGLL